jgi:hypothetical protein
VIDKHKLLLFLELLKVYALGVYLHRNPFQKGKKLYFLHIPKTAGTSISEALFQIAKEKELKMIGPILLDHLVDRPNWEESDILTGHLGLLPLGFKFDYFTVLREPLERLYSDYSHVKRDSYHYFHRTIVEENLDFLGYLQDRRFYSHNFNMQTRYLSTTPRLGDSDISDVHNPKAYAFENSDVSDISLKRATRILEKALWVGDLNNLNQLERFLEKKFDISGVELPFLNLNPEGGKTFSSLEIEAAKPLIELDTAIYQRWKSLITR